MLRLPYELMGVAAHRLQVAVAGEASFVAETTIEVPALHAAHYGESLPGADESLGLWWCSSGWKISSQRPVPKQQGTAMVILPPPTKPKPLSWCCVPPSRSPT